MAQIKLDIRGNANLTSDEIDTIYEIIKQHIPSDDSYMEGNITTEGCYEDAANAIHDRFPKVSIEAAKYFVRFKDPEVLRVLLANATHADENVITEEELGNITDIGEWFRNNINIKTFDELKYSGVKYLRARAFSDCTSLESIPLDNVEQIEAACFARTALTEIVTPLNAKFYRNNFYDQPEYHSYDLYRECPNLKKATLRPFIGGCDTMFMDCVSLETLIIEEGVTSIGDGFARRCKKLTKVTLPSTLTSIGKLAFRDCTNLIIEEIPVGVTSIAENVFRDCTSIKKLKVLSNSVAQLYDNWSCLPPNATIYVPDELLSQYATATNWETYYNAGKIKPISQWVD